MHTNIIVRIELRAVLVSHYNHNMFFMQTEKMLSAWMLWFQRRHKQYEDWAEEGEPKVMWLSGIQIPETYIAALVQTACRDKGWPLDRSTTYTQVTYHFVCCLNERRMTLMLPLA